MDKKHSDTQKLLSDHENPELLAKGDDDVHDDAGQIAPPDKYHLAYFIFFLMGSGVLVPWVTILSAVDYFLYLYPSYHFDFNASVAYIYSEFLTLLFMVKFGSRFRLAPRIYGAFTAFALLFIVIPLLTVKEGLSEAAGFGITITIVAILGLVDGLVQGTLFGFASSFAPIYTQAINAGTGCAGFFISFSRVLTKLSWPDTPKGLKDSALIYFAICSVIMFTCVGAFFVLLKLPITKYYLQRTSNSGALHIKRSKSTEIVEEKMSEADVRKHFRAGLKSVFKKIYPTAILIAGTYWITMTIFPGLISIIPSTKKDWSWLPVITVTVFNFCDFVGKSAVRIIPDRFVSEKALYVLGGFRIIFFPLFLLCVKPRIFNHDAIPIALVVVFSLTNAYIATRAMMIAPTRVPLHERELAGSMMVFALSVGLTAGVSSGWLIPYIL
eukprot:TRINITY_DN4901_c0_g1_i1.p1 TRINITY_DN4901_c0_g1~~TRINITY_DN4901_c0_g1_i1.p1  ORF type:complete len:440 (-),score=57.54 TRINITY_DN4901_c0_g1_i1:54-1373(-)